MTSIKSFVKSLPVLGPIAVSVRSSLLGRRLSSRFPGTVAFWESRYAAGGDSGCGSYGCLAEFKAEVINAFVRENGVRSVIDWGCGDGNQLGLAQYEEYIGVDVSQAAIARCARVFGSDKTKSFYLYHPSCLVDNARLFHADLALSLDVIFHRVENDIFESYLRHLFDSGDRFVIIYSSNFDAVESPHVRCRCFTPWVEANRPDWRLCGFIPNRYPYDANDPDNTSLSDFYIYERSESEGS